MSAPKMGGPAFPVPMMLDDHGNLRHSGEHLDWIGGMTLWDYYAAAALQSYIATGGYARDAARQADAMLAERGKRMDQDYE